MQVSRSAAHALQVVTESPGYYDAIISEVDFPLMTGLEAIARSKTFLAQCDR